MQLAFALTALMAIATPHGDFPIRYRSNSRDLVTIQSAIKYSKKAPWGSVEVFETESLLRGSQQLAVKVEGSENGHKKFLFSSTAFSKAMKLPLIRRSSSTGDVFSSPNIPTEEALLEILLRSFRVAVSDGACSVSDARATFIKYLLVGNIEGNPDPSLDVYQRALSIEPFYNEVWNDVGLCHSTWPAFLLIQGTNPRDFQQSGSIRSLYAAAVLNRIFESRCNRKFAIGTTSQSDFNCAVTAATEVPPLAIKPLDLVWPIYGYAVALSNFQRNGIDVTNDSRILFERLVEIGIYLPDLPFTYGSKGRGDERVLSVTGDGQEIGPISTREISGMLLDTVPMGKCRALLTGNGMKNYCIKSAD